MANFTVEYSGDLHCLMTHGRSGSQVETDAPPDNNGKGERFSPTDLVCAALGACMITIMGIVAQRDGVSLEGLRAEIDKTMSPPPRRIARVGVVVHMPAGLTPEYRRKLENSALTCPVKKSLHPDVDLPISFVYPDA
jgi:putative redox protein